MNCNLHNSERDLKRQRENESESEGSEPGRPMSNAPRGALAYVWIKGINYEARQISLALGD